MSDKLEFTLLTNGLDFIESAIDHLSGSPSARDLKYGTLHLAAGIELVLKERLKNEHWTLVFAKPELASRANYDAGRFRSVALDDSLKRLADVIGVTISLDHQRQLRNLREKRNKLEHLGTTDSAEAFKAVTAEALAFIIDFMGTHLDVKGFGEGDRQRLKKIREGLKEFERFKTERWKAIRKEVDKAAYALTCPSCDQDALILDEGFRCRFCGYADEPRKVLDRFVAEVLGVTWHDIAEGGECPVSSCPKCGAGAMVDCGSHGDINPSCEFVCFECGNAWKEGELSRCGYCGEFHLSNLEYCPSWANHHASKDD